MLEILLLDDDRQFLEVLQSQTKNGLLQRGFTPVFHSMVSAEEAQQALDRLERLDLALLDIDMGSQQENGLTVARAIRTMFPNCTIMFVTAYLNYATEVYEVQPMYFILKDQFEQRLDLALELFQKKYRQDQTTLSVTVGRKKQLIPINSILFFERENRRTRLITISGELMLWDSLQTLLSKLPDGQFAACHKSYLVSIRWIANYDRTSVTLTTGQSLPISRSHREEFRGKVMSYIKAELA